MVAVQMSLPTQAEYLAFERERETNHDYVAGEVCAIVGARLRHNLLQSSTLTYLNHSLASHPCIAMPSDMRVEAGALGIYAYPAITVVCGEVELDDAEQDTPLNPTMIVEILSPSPERYDRGPKFHRYQPIPSLRGYLLIGRG